MYDTGNVKLQAPQKMCCNGTAYMIYQIIRINVWMTGKDQTGDKLLLWDSSVRPSYYFQRDNHPECVQLLGMTLASHLQEQGKV